MKKLLLGSLALTLFSISIIIFQLSCKKEATAQTTGSIQQLGKLVFLKSDNSGSALDEIWTSNYDGTSPPPLVPTPQTITSRGLVFDQPTHRVKFFAPLDTYPRIRIRQGLVFDQLTNS